MTFSSNFDLRNDPEYLELKNLTSLTWETKEENVKFLILLIPTTALLLFFKLENKKKGKKQK